MNLKKKCIWISGEKKKKSKSLCLLIDNSELKKQMNQNFLRL